MKVRVNTRLIRAAAGLLALAVVLLTMVFVVRAWEERQSKVPQSVLDAQKARQEQERVQYNGGWYTPKQHLETVLVLGLDKYADTTRTDVQGAYEQADFLLLLVLDKEAKTATALHLNRDTMTQIQVLTDAGALAQTVEGQLTLAHTYGGTGEIRCKNTVTAVSGLLRGIEIHHYLSLTMDGVAKLNDLAGGVTVEVMDDFSGIDSALVKGERVTLKGDQALIYVRARRGMEDASNTHRMERQRQYLEALQAQLSSQGRKSEDFTLSALMELNEYMVSDFSVEQLSDFSKWLEDYGVKEYRALEGESKVSDTYVEFYPDERKLQALVMELFYDPADDDEE